MIWDFDGTLAWREGLWSGCVLEVLDEHEPGHRATRDALRRLLSGGFPWHRHETAHPELAEADAWWEALGPLLRRAMTGCGIDELRARELCPAVRERFVDAGRVWRLFDDSREALTVARDAGLRNAILSNHVPELAALAGALGIGDEVDEVFSSAVTGYEKPHPEAFRMVLRRFGDPAERWMVGDNPRADVAGAEALGIPAVLVRTEGDARRRADDAVGAVRTILAGVPRAEPPAGTPSRAEPPAGTASRG